MAALDNVSPDQFYHGTRADLKVGDMIEPGHPKVWAEHSHSTKVYFGDKETANKFATGSAFTGQQQIGQPKVYPVEPTGRHWENKIGNEGAVARASRDPLRVTGPAEPWRMRVGVTVADAKQHTSPMERINAHQAKLKAKGMEVDFKTGRPKPI